MNVGTEDTAAKVLAVASGALAASMVAEPGGSMSLRGSDLAQRLSQAASMAGGDVFQEAASSSGLSGPATALAISAGTQLTTNAIGSLCSKRYRAQADSKQEKDDELADMMDKDSEAFEKHSSSGLLQADQPAASQPAASQKAGQQVSNQSVSQKAASIQLASQPTSR